MTLQYLLDSQRTFQTRMGTDFTTMHETERSAFIKEHGYFLMEEVMEMFREMPFHKSWKDYSDWGQVAHLLAKQKMKEEAIDALHFMMNIFLALGMDEKEILSMYNEKNKLNYERQENAELGYVQSTMKSEEL